MYFAAVALVGATLGQPVGNTSPAAAPVPMLQDYHFYAERDIKLPIKYEKARNTIRQVLLYVAVNGENTWYQEGAVSPDRDHFIYKAKDDGVYWFTIVIEDLQGHRDITDITKTTPDMKVIVKTTKPRIQLTDTPERVGDSITIKWVINDKYPNDNATKVHFKPVGAPNDAWREVSIHPTSKNGVMFSAGTLEPIIVRVTGYDMALNKAEITYQFEGATRTAPAASTTVAATGQTAGPISPAAPTVPSSSPTGPVPPVKPASPAPQTPATPVMSQPDSLSPVPPPAPSAPVAPVVATSPVTPPATGPVSPAGGAASPPPVAPSVPNSVESLAAPHTTSTPMPTMSAPVMPPAPTPTHTPSVVGSSTPAMPAAPVMPAMPPPPSTSTPTVSGSLTANVNLPVGTLNVSASTPLPQTSQSSPSSPAAPVNVGIGVNIGSAPSTNTAAMAPIESRQTVVPALSLGNGASSTGNQTPLAAWTGSISAPANQELPHALVINYLTFDLAYEVESRGPSGISRVDLWVTRDDGRTWLKWSQHDGKGPNIRVNLNLPSNPQPEGMYGFRIVPVSGAGLSEREPAAGDAPDLRVIVDVTPPQLDLFSPVSDPASPDTLIIQWKASDKNWAEDPITIEWSDRPTGPWQPVAVGNDVVQTVGGASPPVLRRLPNTGQYAWHVPAGLSPRVYLKVSARDAAGNVREVITRDPILIDLVKPKGKINGIVPPPTTSLTRQ
jgi:hypothetical protein